MYEGFLRDVVLLQGLSHSERSKIADALVSRVYEDGEQVVRQGEVGDTFFFVEEGEALVRKRVGNGDEVVVVGKLVKGDYFGELSLLRLAPRAATVEAVVRPTVDAKKIGPKLKVAALDAPAFTRLLGPLREIMERRAGESYLM
ncbi:camp-dependent protein kinase regulatory subunit [Lentinula edodes]|uniref:Camp-dependent protein kinase regulatory subunit n=1 Tax=Lentinula edodes TaxID=5353 RepID=A0A1Q3DVY9_LENED|nr:camp-dependent protein kinase regulatory subunit [Lentinula edodes]